MFRTALHVYCLLYNPSRLILSSLSEREALYGPNSMEVRTCPNPLLHPGCICASFQEYLWHYMCLSFPAGASGKESVCNAGDTRDSGSIPGWGRPPGVWNGNLPLSSCLENSMARGAWRATIHGVAESDRPEWLSTHVCAHTHTHTHTFSLSIHLLPDTSIIYHSWLCVLSC